MKILVAGQNYRVVGGADRYMVDVVSLLAGGGHHVAPFAAYHPESIPSAWGEYFPRTADFEEAGLKDALEYIYSRSAKSSISGLLDEFQPDIAHLNIYYGKLTTSILGELKRRRVPIVQTLHDYKVVCPIYRLQLNGRNCEACQGRHFWRATANRCNRGSLARSALSSVESYFSRINGDISSINRFITVSEFQRKKLISLGLPADRTVTIPNFTEPDSVLSRSPAGYFFYFGRIEREKGIYTLVDAFKKTGLRLRIAGGGTELAALKNYCADTKNIETLGPLQGDALRSEVRNAVAAVFPSECLETFGLVAIESMAVGTPVIAADIGAIPEIVRHRSNGLLFSPGDSSQLAKCTLELSTQPEFAREMGVQGYQDVLRFFSPQSHLARLEEVYSDVL